MPKISVIMSVYKEPIEWMRQSIDSILNQTYTNFECIIVNDKPDRKENAQLLNEYAQKDSRIKIIANEQNIGLTKSLNKGLAVAQGEYIARMDADDVSLPNRFEEQSKLLDNDNEVMVCGSDVVTLDKDGKVGSIIKTCHTDDDIKVSMIFQSPIIHPVSMFRKCIGKKAIRYNEYYACAQDYALWVDLFGYKMANIPQVLLQYRLSDYNITSQKRNLQLTYSKKIQDKVYRKNHLSLDNATKDSIFSLIYNCNESREVNNENLLSDCRSFVNTLCERFANSAVNTLKAHLVICYIRYSLQKEGGRVFNDYIKFCRTINYPITKKINLLLKFYVASKLGR